ncbi:MAG: hypothetical protein K0S74_67 [Chlamydiales bacterium]|jgi:hypothetical protein|nr:hypothetical protein [Chlamydiales bacterium]
MPNSSYPLRKFHSESDLACSPPTRDVHPPVTDLFNSKRNTNLSHHIIVQKKQSDILNKDILNLCFQYLEPHELYDVALVSKTWNNVANGTQLWSEQAKNYIQRKNKESQGTILELDISSILPNQKAFLKRVLKIESIQENIKAIHKHPYQRLQLPDFLSTSDNIILLAQDNSDFKSGIKNKLRKIYSTISRTFTQIEINNRQAESEIKKNSSFMYPISPLKDAEQVYEAHFLSQSSELKKIRNKYTYRYEHNSYISRASTYIALNYPAKKFTISLPANNDISYVLIFRQTEYEEKKSEPLNWNLIDRVPVVKGALSFVYEDTAPTESQYHKIYDPNDKMKQLLSKDYRGSANFTYLLHTASTLTSAYKDYLETKPLDYSANIISTILGRKLGELLTSLDSSLTELDREKLIKSLFEGYNKAWEHYKEETPTDFIEDIFNYYIAVIKGFMHDQLPVETALYCRENICHSGLGQALDNVSIILPLRNGRIDFIEVKREFDLLCAKRSSKINYRRAKRVLIGSLLTFQTELLQ